LRELGDWDDAHPFSLYRLVGVAGDLVYVGITRQSVRARLVEHRRRDWWPAVARIEVTHGYSEAEARRCELAAIKGDHPHFNRQGAA